MKSKYILLHVLAAALLLTGLILVGCKGDPGPAGPAGSNGTNPEHGPIITAIMASPDSVGAGTTTQVLVAAYDPNGDTLSYAWTANMGSFTSPNASTSIWTAPEEGGLAVLRVTVTARGATATDSVRVGVNMRVPIAGASYLGNNVATCSQCHAGIATGYTVTNHANAWQHLVESGSDTNKYCQQCHTVGFDDKYDHSGNLLSHGADTTGYDNNQSASLTAVQCESCHGKMGPAPLNHAPQPLAGIVNGEKCRQCHSQNAELDSSGHGTVIARAGGQAAFLTEWGGSGCNPCHVSEGFIAGKDPNFASTGLPMANQIGCATCHDPHNKTNDMQLRTVGDATSPYGGTEMPTSYTISGFGNGQLCVQCHHGRRSASQINGQINAGSAHPGPHESPQGDMVSGRGDYELPGAMNRTNQHPLSDSRLSDVCASCHMYTIARGQPGGPIFGHKFSPDVRMCQQCHPGADNFDIGGVQTEVRGLLDSLAIYLPHDSLGAVPSSMDTVNWTLDQRKAGYTYYFVEADGSHGVHNSNYTISILRNAIASLAGRPN